LQAQDSQFDLAIATDVFIYIGDLSRVFQGVRRALRENGLFCFSVESVSDGDFVLRGTLRYAHSTGYLQGLAKQHDFIIEMMAPQIIRKDSGADIHGHHVVMRASRPSASLHPMS
jgi:predicted TPR repeat methyltransferase